MRLHPNRYVYLYTYMTDFSTEYTSRMEVTKQKSKEISETDILFKAVTD